MCVYVCMYVCICIYIVKRRHKQNLLEIFISLLRSIMML